MIKLQKLEKPKILIDNDISWTDLYIKSLNGDTSIPQSIKNKYSHKEIKNILLAETYHKCCYCESKITHIDFGDIEHILPKALFPELYVEWSNLTISCGVCNTNKSDYYSKEFPLSNPYKDNVEEEYIFAGPIVLAKSDKGNKTLKKLQLNRISLIEARTRLIHKIQPFISSINQTNDTDLRRMLIEDLRKYTEIDKEYSLMMKHVFKLEIFSSQVS